MTSTSRKTVRLPGASGAISDHSLNRLIGILIAVIAIGLPAIGLVYYADRHVDRGGDTDAEVVSRRLEAAYYGLAVIALEQNRPRDAATQLANALNIDRTDADALNLMGTALIAIGDLPNAVDALRDAVALVPTGWGEPYAQMKQAYTGL